MTLGEKLREIRRKFNLSQEDLAIIINVSRQAITKWENDLGIPDIDNLKELSHTFGVSVDYLIDNKCDLPLLVMRRKLDKNQYKSKLSSYLEVLKEYYLDWEIYSLMREKKKNIIEKVIDFFVDIMPITLANLVSDMSPYYLVKKNGVYLLINIKDWVLEITELDSNINEKKFIVNNNIFKKSNQIIFKK